MQGLERASHGGSCCMPPAPQHPPAHHPHSSPRVRGSACLASQAALDQRQVCREAGADGSKLSGSGKSYAASAAAEPRVGGSGSCTARWSPRALARTPSLRSYLPFTSGAGGAGRLGCSGVRANPPPRKPRSQMLPPATRCKQSHETSEGICAAVAAGKCHGRLSHPEPRTTRRDGWHQTFTCRSVRYWLQQMLQCRQIETLRWYMGKVGWQGSSAGYLTSGAAVNGVAAGTTVWDRRRGDKPTSDCGMNT